MFIKNAVMTVLAGALFKSYLLLMDFNEWRAKRKGYLCSD